MWLSLLLSAALAQSDEVPAAPSAAGTEIVVYGEAAVRDARADIVRAFESQGWKSHERGDGVLVFHPPESWMGRALVDREGSLWFRDPVVAFKAVEAQEPFDTETNPNLQSGTGSVQAGFYILPSKRKTAAAHHRVELAVHAPINTYKDVLTATRFQADLQALPDALDVLWKSGYFQGQNYASPADRRTAVLQFWSTRSSSAEGDAVSAAVEAWLRATVMPDDPVTPAEEDAAEARRADGRKLDLNP